jgi:hypothetical protein
MKTNRAFDFFFVLFLVVGLGLAAFNRQHIRDWWTLRSYQPSTQVSQLATNAGFNNEGRRLFYISNPQFVSQADLDQTCSPENLGCIKPNGQIFLLQVSPVESQDDLVVTAAHEMLHQAYRRLSNTEKATLAKLSEAYLASSDNDSLKTEMAGITDPDERADELHSILGSEILDLPSGLIEHYDRYFSDRSLSTKAYDQTQK